MSRPRIVCMTPVKNEGWILRSFLAAATLWADRIVIGDDGSTDETRAIAQSFDKVHLFDLPSRSFNEDIRRRHLVDGARSVARVGDVLISLDADEALSADMLSAASWEPVFAAPPGTVIRMWFTNIAPDRVRVWRPYQLAVGFVDDGRRYRPEAPIHTRRVPEGSDELVLDDQAVLHRQYLDWEGMRAKQRFYQVWELVNRHRGPLDIWRMYHHMDVVREEEFVPLDSAWVDGYERAGIDLLGMPTSNADYWDRAVLDLLARHGIECCRRLDLWDVDWPSRCRQLERPCPAGCESDPRTLADRAAHWWLAKTQGKVPKPRPVWWGERLLRVAGW